MVDTEEPRQFTEEDAQAVWQHLAEPIDELARAGASDSGIFRPQRGSSLAGDDARTTPYQLSHAVGQCVTAAVDHLHAVKCLVVDLRVLHVAAPASLARGVLENAATAYWMLHPRSRPERLTRALRWYVENYKAQGAAMGPLDVPHPGRTAEEVLQHIKTLAKERGLDRGAVMNGYTSTAVLKYADAHALSDRRHVLFPWQLCSGFAHGRSWAYLGISQREEFPTQEAGVMSVKLTNTLSRSLYPTLIGYRLLEEVQSLRRLRAGYLPAHMVLPDSPFVKRPAQR